MGCRDIISCHYLQDILYHLMSSLGSFLPLKYLNKESPFKFPHFPHLLTSAEPEGDL